MIFDSRLATTANDVPGHRTVENLALIRGIVVRSRGTVGDPGADPATGGGNAALAEWCEDARLDAFIRMLERAAELGANAVIGVRYDSSPLADGVIEIVAYGTAVRVEPI